MVNQIWKPVPAYEELYSISNDGLVTSNHKRNKGMLIQPRVDRGGYLSLRLHREGKTQTLYLHRLLAQAFIPNPQNKKYVNHRNGNKLDNSLKNLEFVHHKENVLHAFKHGLNSSAKKVVDTQTGKIFYSIKQAAKETGMNYNTCCKHLAKNTSPHSLRYFRQLRRQ